MSKKSLLQLCVIEGSIKEFEKSRCRTEALSSLGFLKESKVLQTFCWISVNTDFYCVTLTINLCTSKHVDITSLCTKYFGGFLFASRHKRLCLYAVDRLFILVWKDNRLQCIWPQPLAFVWFAALYNKGRIYLENYTQLKIVTTMMLVVWTLFLLSLTSLDKTSTSVKTNLIDLQS